LVYNVVLVFNTRFLVFDACFEDDELYVCEKNENFSIYALSIQQRILPFAPFALETLAEEVLEKQMHVSTELPKILSEIELLEILVFRRL